MGDVHQAKKKNKKTFSHEPLEIGSFVIPQKMLEFPTHQPHTSNKDMTAEVTLISRILFKISIKGYAFSSSSPPLPSV